MPDNASGFDVQKDALPEQPNISYSPKYFFVELTSLDDLVFPNLVTKRVKFTCIASSARLIVLGTSSGTGYVFSRFRQKNRLTSAGSSMSPVEMFVTKDGPICCLAMSPSEQMVAVGSDSGRISVTSLNANNQHSSIIYTLPGNAQKPDKVTFLLWSLDNKILYSGHSSGTINLHKLTVRSVFRSSHEVMCSLDGAVTQLNLLGSLLLASTTVASHVYDLEQSTSVTIGTKTRNSKMGACFVKAGGETTSNSNHSTNCEYILAARPNGKVWEANTAGVVYRTHQFRQSSRIVRSHIVSFREPFCGDQSREEESLESAANMDINLQNLYTINVDGTTLLVTWFSSYMILLEIDSSDLVVMTNFGEEIVDLSICGTDIFILLVGKSALRKVSVLCSKSTVAKLEQRQCYAQCGQVILRTCCDTLWDASTILRVAESLNAPSSGKRKKNIENEKLRIALYELLESQHEISQSQYDNVGSSLGDVSAAVKTSIKIPSPSESDQDIADSKQSYVEDEFGTHLVSPLREKSRSSPCVESPSSFIGLSSAYTSMPVTNDELIDCSVNGVVDVTREDILTRAKVILENNGQLVDNASLRFLLQLECVAEDVKFIPTVTVDNVAAQIAQIAMTSPINLPAVFNSSRKLINSRPRRPAIIKPVRPTTKRVAVHIPLANLEANSNIVNAASDLPTIRQEVYTVPAESNEENSLERNTLEADWLDRRLNVISAPEVSECRVSPPISSESGSSASFMIGEAKEAVESYTHCLHCFLHRSWLTVSLLSAVCKRVNVQEAIFSEGGVPSNAVQWTSLFERKRQLLDTDNTHSISNVCPRCEAGLAVAAKSTGCLPTNSGLVRDDIRMNTASIQERMSAADPQKLKSVLFGTKKSTEKYGYHCHKSGVMSNPDEKIALARICENETHNICLNLDISTLLPICSSVLGYIPMVELVKNSKLFNILSSSDWSVMIALALREQSFRKNVIGQKVLKDVLESIDMLSMVDVESVSVVPQRLSYSNKISVPLIFSWIINSSGICPICSTCLSGQTLSTLQVTTFSCGHSYHSTCLAQRVSCLACRLRARKKSTVAIRNG